MSTLMHRNTETPSAAILVTRQSLHIREIAESRLRNSQYPPVRSLSCEYHEGVLTIRGRVATYYLKQIAQAVVDGLDGVLEIANRVDVVRANVPQTERSGTSAVGLD